MRKNQSGAIKIHQLQVVLLPFKYYWSIVGLLDCDSCAQTQTLVLLVLSSCVVFLLPAILPPESAPLDSISNLTADCQHSEHHNQQHTVLLNWIQFNTTYLYNHSHKSLTSPQTLTSPCPALTCSHSQTEPLQRPLE